MFVLSDSLSPLGVFAMDYMKLAKEDFPDRDHWVHVFWAILMESVDNVFDSEDFVSAVSKGVSK